MSYDSIYRARASSSGTTLDVFVPQVFGDIPIRVTDSVGGQVPGMGWVMFQGGDPAYPVWLADIGLGSGGNIVVEGGGGANEVFVGPDQPTDPSVELWYDTDATGAGGTVVQAVQAGSSIAVDATDATRPIVSLSTALFRSGSATGPGGTMSTGNTIISTSIPSHATLARTASIALSLLCGTDGTGGDLQLIINGGYVMGWRFPNPGQTQCMVTFTRHNYAIPANTATAVSIRWTGASSFVTFPDPAFNMLSWQTWPA